MEQMTRDDQIGLSVCIPLAAGCAWNHSLIALALILFMIACGIWLPGPQTETEGDANV